MVILCPASNPSQYSHLSGVHPPSFPFLFIHNYSNYTTAHCIVCPGERLPIEFTTYCVNSVNVSLKQNHLTPRIQLLDFRQVIARMLGLDVNSLAVPDYEIIARLEKLILANKSNVATVVALDTALDDMEDGFRAGYEDASRVLATVPRARSPMRSRMGPAHARSRSLSPRRKRDKRIY